LVVAVSELEERRRRGENARARVEEKFGMLRLVDELAALYAEVAWSS
jgi:glycosyltransferase involved in cell wall biosynthesis